jgi:HEAT repeat protein
MHYHLHWIHHGVTLPGVPNMPMLRFLVLLAGILILGAGNASHAQKDKGKGGGGGGGPVAKPEEKKKEEKPEKVLSPTEADEKTLRDAHLDVTGAALLDLLHKRMPASVTRDQVASLIKQLADKNADVHNKASSELVKLGTAAVPLLNAASRDVDDLDTANRAKQCVTTIQSTHLLAACVHLLVERNPEGTAETLFKFLPFADDEALGNEIVQALGTACFRGGSTHPALLKALEDPVPLRRATAAELLCRQSGEAHLSLVRKLLHDPKAHVRMRTALALADLHDVQAVPVLIDLLADLPAGLTKPVEDYLMQLAGEWGLTVPPADDPTARRLRRDLWAAWWNSLDGPALVEEFYKRTVADAEREKAEAIIARLSAESPQEREKAEADILAMGNNAVPSLRKALHGSAPRNTDAIRRCLDLLKRTADAPLPTAAARLLGLRRPAGSAGVLLAYLPCAEEDSMANEVRDALTRVAIQEGKIDPALIKALDDKLALRRQTAAESICHAGSADDRALVKKLLNDPNSEVKLRVALALAGAREKDAIPSLIALLDQLPLDQVGEAEDYLRQLAGDNAPKVAEGEDAETRRKHKEEWGAWWKANSSKIELARTDGIQKLLGYTLMVEAWSPWGRGGGRVMEVDSAGKKRWEITNLQYPTDACVIGHDRVLIAEYSSSQVTERDFKGKILWTKQCANPTGAQRLPSGNTLITMRQQLIEVDRTGKEVWSWSPTSGMEICQAQRLRNGQTAVLDSAGMYMRLDSKGKQLRSAQVGMMHGYGAGAEFLSNDHVLMPLINENKVVEYNASGKIVWEAHITMPCSAHRLPNGNVLVALQNSRSVVELNRAGKQVWEYKENFQPHYARRR